LSKIANYLKVLLIVLIFSYFFIEFDQQEELMIGLTIVATVIVLIDGLRFRKKEKDSIELGEKYDFRQSSLFRFGFPIAIFVFFYIFIESVHYDWFPEGIERTTTNPFITLLILIPQTLEHIIALTTSGSKTLYYATQEGLLRSIQGDEIKKWNDFYGYSIDEGENLIKFKMKNLKYFSIQYDKEYFHDYKKEIISFLDSKLTRQ